MLREILARFGIRVDTAPLRAAQGAITGMIGSLGALGGLLVGGVIVRGLQNFVREMIDLGDETAKTARQLGISADALSAWRFAAERSGVDAGALTNGLRRLQRNISDATEGLATPTRAFDSMGVSATDAEGRMREIEDILPDIADGFTGLATDTERSARAQELFGRSGALLLPLFENGSQGIADLTARFEELTGGSFGEFFVMAEEGQDALADLDLAMLAIKARIAATILPAFTDFLGRLTAFAVRIREATEGTDVWKVGLIGLGSVAAAVALAMFVAFLKPIALLLLIAAAITAAILLYDDFITFLEGGESAIGTILDNLFGAGSAEQVRTFLVGAGESFLNFIRGSVIPAIEEMGRNLGFFWDDVKLVAETISNAFSSTVASITTTVEQAINLIRSLFTAVENVALQFGASVGAVLENIGNTINRIRASFATVAGIFGVSGVANVAAPRAGSATETSVNQNQTNTFNIQGGGDPRSVANEVRRVISEANQVAIRSAQRALTQVAG